MFHTPWLDYLEIIDMRRLWKLLIGWFIVHWGDGAFLIFPLSSSLRQPLEFCLHSQVLPPWSCSADRRHHKVRAAEGRGRCASRGRHGVVCDGSCKLRCLLRPGRWHKQRRLAQCKRKWYQHSGRWQLVLDLRGEVLQGSVGANVNSRGQMPSKAVQLGQSRPYGNWAWLLKWS